MRKLIFNDLMIITLLCVIFPLGLYSQTNSKNDDLVNDTKFWFSKEQLEQKAKVAIMQNVFLTRCYVRGKEFTEEGEVKISQFSDSKLILRISGKSHKELIIKCIPVNPYDVIRELSLINVKEAI